MYIAGYPQKLINASNELGTRAQTSIWGCVLFAVDIPKTDL